MYNVQMYDVGNSRGTRSDAYVLKVLVLRDKEGVTTLV